MNKYLLPIVLALLVNGSFGIAHAATLSISLPNNSNVFSISKNSSFDARIYVNGLADFGAFDFSLSFNSTNLLAQSLTSASIFGAGSDTDVFANSITAIGSSGKIHFAESISATSPLTGGLNIAAPTLLGTIHFKALNVSTNNDINFVISQTEFPLIYSFDGTSLSGTVQGARVNIQAPQVVPVPGALLMFISGLAMVLGKAKRRVVLG